MGLLCKLLEEEILKTEMFLVPAAVMIVSVTGTDIRTDINVIDFEDWRYYGGEMAQYIECSTMKAYHEVCAEFVELRKDTVKLIKAAKDAEHPIFIVGAPELLDPAKLLDTEAFLAKYDKRAYIDRMFQPYRK